MSRRRYVIVVPASQPALLEYLERRFKQDVLVSVVLDRRRTARPVAADAQRMVLLEGVTVVAVEEATITQDEGSTTPNAGGAAMTDGVELDDRQRVDRWLEESQYLLGRLIPGYLDDRDRLKVKVATAEQEAERLRREIEELRREVVNLQGELHYQRTEHSAAAEAFAGVLQQLTELQKPLSEVHRRLQSAHPTVGNGTHA